MSNFVYAELQLDPPLPQEPAEDKDNKEVSTVLVVDLSPTEETIPI